MDENSLKINHDVSSVVSEIRSVIDAARNNVARQVNTELLSTYWNIGRIICEYEQTLPERADYGKQTLRILSKELTKELGKGFSVSNIQFMRRFYQTYQIQQTVSVKLSWSHYCELLTITDDRERQFYEKDVENALFSHLENFFLELGRGFMYVGRQQRVTVNNTHYYVDMVFYNKILKAYVLIELKRTKLTPETAGQLNMYLNYYQNEVNDVGDNPLIGIILCTEKDSIATEYALGGLSNKIFASRYVLYLPNKEDLIAQVESVLKNQETK